MSIEELRRHRDLYYNGTPEISDAEYDALEQELSDQGVDVSQVGAKPSGLFEDVEHEHPMLSLDKGHNHEDLDKFLDRFENEEFLVGPKFDGVSISLIYEDGELQRAVTRGDGYVGEDVTETIEKSVPVKLDPKLTIEIRGEMLMLRSHFDEVKEEFGFANPRNAASGTIRKKTFDPSRKLTFMPFDVAGQIDGDVRDVLRSVGHQMTGFEKLSTREEIIEYIDRLEADRNNLDFEVDGVVIRVFDRDLYTSLGSTSHHPRGAIAYKLTPEIQETTLQSVTWQVGKSGTVAPVGEVTPVLVSGTTISRVSLHNAAMIAEKDLRIGDRVEIKRAGDVIPHIVGPVTGKRDRELNPVTIPTECPSCGESLIEVGESRILLCENINCKAQAERRLIHWASRAAADIDAVGEKLVKELFNRGLATRISDLYRLTADDPMELDRMGERRVQKILDSIQGSKDVGMRRAMIGFSIPLASEGTAKRLVKAGFTSVEAVAKASAEELEQVEDIGPQVAASLISFFENPKAIEEIETLRKLGVDLDAEQVTQTESALTGKRVCITGTLTVSRGEFKSLLEAGGANVTGSVSKNLDILVCGEKAGSKQAKAEGLGVQIMTEEEARNALA